MERVHILYDKLRKKEPFCFIKLNDGECSIMQCGDPTVVASRGDQLSSEGLSQKLKKCLKFQHPNYFVGLPCSKCYGGRFRDLLISVLDNARNIDDDPNFMNANVLINSNTLTTLSTLQESLTDASSIVVISNRKNIENIDRLSEFLSARIHMVESVSETNAFDESYERVAALWRSIPNHSVVICMCGPLGRVLCYKWFKKNPTLTCLELGSLFDPILKARSYSYHQNTLPICSECNPVRLSNRAFLAETQDEIQMATEVFYLPDIPGYLNFYRHDYPTIRKALWYRFNRELHVYHQWLADLDLYLEQLWTTEMKVKTRREMEIHLFHVNNCQDYEKMKFQAKIYIDYFRYLHNDEVHRVMFYYAFAFSCLGEKEAAIASFEELLSEKNLSDNLSTSAKAKLEDLYDRNPGHIPRVIHLIYFKVRDLEEYNYRCIASMAHYMPDYKILIHNDIEPVGNLWWEKIKSIKSVELHHMDRPTHFDGFKLHCVQYQADVARLNVLYEHGGIYLDLDMLILRNFEDVFSSGKDFYISEENPKNKDGGTGLINSFIASKPKNEFITQWLEGFKSGLRMENWAYHIRETNLVILKNKPHFTCKYRIEILDHKHFFPLLWPDSDAFRSVRQVDFGEDTYGVHLFDTIYHDVLVKNLFFPNLPKDFEDVHGVISVC